MSEAETAYRAAVAEIERVKRWGGDALDLSESRFRKLEKIPPETKDIVGLRRIDLRETAISDLRPLEEIGTLQTLWLDQSAVTNLSPLAGLTSLQWLSLEQTAVDDLTAVIGLPALCDLELTRTSIIDLRPIIGLTKLGTSGLSGLKFASTPCTESDAELAMLAQISDMRLRASETLAYLRSLPPWPEPYTPNSRPDGKPPEPIGRLEPPEPAIPAPTLAPLQVVEEGGVLRLATPGDALDTQSRLLARQGWQALRDFLADLAEMRPRIGNQMPTMDKALSRFDAGLGAEFGQVNPIALGTHGNRIIRLADTADESLSAADAAELVEFAAAIALFLERFAEWRAYREDALSHPPSAAEVQNALPPINAIVDGLFDRAEIDTEIGRNLKDQLAAVREQSGDALSAKGLIASTRNVLGRLAEAAWRAVKSGGRAAGTGAVSLSKKTWEKTEDIAATTLSGAAIDIFANKARLLHLLAATLPEQFGWLEAVLKALHL